MDVHTAAETVLFPGTGLWAGFEWRFLYQGCLWSRWSTLCQALLTGERTTTSSWLKRVFFLHLDWKGLLMQRALAGSPFLCLAPSFCFFRYASHTGHVFASPLIFRLFIHFFMGSWTRSRTRHLLVSWVDEYQSHALRAKAQPCGKVNKCLTW